MLGGSSSPLPLPPGGGSSVGSGSGGGFGGLHQHERMVGSWIWGGGVHLDRTLSDPISSPLTSSHHRATNCTVRR